MQISQSFLRCLISLWIITSLSDAAIGQSKNAITIAVKSTQGQSIPGATITIHSQQDELLKTGVTEVDGRFKTEKLFKTDQTITLKVSKPGFSEKEITHRVRNQNGSANVVEIQLAPRTTITGFVSDSVTLEPVQGAEVSFFDVSGKLIQSRSTNLEGYFEFETDFTFGEIIKVRVSKMYYFPREKTLRIVKPEREENRVDIRIPKVEDTGIKVAVRVFDRKNGKVMTGGKLRYPERGKPKEVLVPANGEVNLNIFQQPGTRLNLRIQKPKYKEIAANPALALDGNNFDYWLEREYRFPVCACIFGGGVVSGLFSGGLYLSSRKAYKAYRDVNNDDPETDYDKANKRLKASVVTGGLAAVLIGGGFLCRHIQKKRDNAPQKPGPLQPYGYIDAFGNAQFGVAFSFNH